VSVTTSAARASTERVETLFVVNGGGGTIVARDDAPGSYTLTIDDVDRHVTWSADRAPHAAGAEAVEYAINSIGFAKPPNAVISTDAAADHDTVGVTLRDPVYDRTAGTLTFNATPLRHAADALDHRLDFLDDRLDSTLAPSFGAVTVFVDDTGTEVRADGRLAPTDPVPTGAAPTAAPGPGLATAPDDDLVTIHVQVNPTKTQFLYLQVEPVRDDYNQCAQAFGQEVTASFGEPNWRDITAFMTTTNTCAFLQSRFHWIGSMKPDIVQRDRPKNINGIVELRVAGGGGTGPYMVNCAPIGSPALPKIDCTWGWHTPEQPLVIRVTQ
jgi:hypothetical protein